MAKLQFKLVRSFSLGFAIHSPTLNGFCVEIFLGCFHIHLWGKGKSLVSFKNYWSNQA